MADNLTNDADIDEAIDTIEQRGYMGFSLDAKNWYCVRHSLDIFFDNAFQAVVEFATGKRERLETPQGQMVYPWFIVPNARAHDSIFCSVGNCPVQVAGEEEDEGDFPDQLKSFDIPLADKDGGYDENEAAELEDYLGPH